MTSTLAIMAAGRGTRMEHLTKDTPKHLLSILGRPFLDYLIDRGRIAGFSRILIVAGYQSDAFQRYQEVEGVEVVVQSDLEKRYGTAAAIAAVRTQVGQSNFAAIAGDNLYSIADLRKLTIDTTTTWLGGYKTAAWKGMGVLKLNEDGNLERIIEKPTTFVGDVINASLYLFTPGIFAAIDKLSPSVRGEYEITDAINLLAETEPVNVFELEERWYDFTTPSDIPKIEKALQQELQ